jgi:hypothetical protein
MLESVRAFQILDLDAKGPIAADLIDAVSHATPASQRAIQLWHPCVDA